VSVFKQVRASCTQHTYLFSTIFFMRENFSVFNARECFVSHLKSPDHSLTLLTLITAVVLSAVASVLRTEGPVASRRCVVFLCSSSWGSATSRCARFFCLSLELDWVSVLSYKLYGFFVLVKKIAITISNSKKQDSLRAWTYQRCVCIARCRDWGQAQSCESAQLKNVDLVARLVDNEYLKCFQEYM